jgi:hypothetical protein
VAFWTEQRYIDAETENVLRQAVELQHQPARAAEQARHRDEEAAYIHAEQARIRDNLQSLGDRPSEKELRERFVRTLTVQEDRLEAITLEKQARTQEQDRCMSEVHELLGAVEYEATLGHA